VAGRSKTSFAKRQREKKKAERASEKRERRGQREAAEESHPVASADDLAALGIESPVDAPQRDADPDRS
jgi:hypothetical protein